MFHPTFCTLALALVLHLVLALVLHLAVAQQQNSQWGQFLVGLRRDPYLKGILVSGQTALQHDMSMRPG